MTNLAIPNGDDRRERNRVFRNGKCEECCDANLRLKLRVISRDDWRVSLLTYA